MEKAGKYELLRSDCPTGETSWILAPKCSAGAKLLAYDSEELPLLCHNAPGHSHTSTESDSRFLTAKIITSYQREDSTILEPCIPGGWVGRSWEEQIPVRHLTAGAATDLRSRIVWETEKLSNQSRVPRLLRCRTSGFPDEESEARLKQSQKVERNLRRYYFGW